MTTNTTTTETFDRMVADFKRAKFIFETTRLGSTKGDVAERKLDRLVAKAEQLGCLDAFVRAVTA